MEGKKKNLALGFDMGTSGLKCVVLNTDTGRHRSVYSEWKMLSPKQGYAEFDCVDIWRHITECIGRLKTEHGVDLGRISSVGFCALCPGLIALDRNGRELTRCIIFMDARSAAETEYINSRISPEESYKITGNRIMSGATSVSTVLWIKNHMPEVYAATACFVHMPTWAGYKLTGELKMDLSNAAGTGLYDVHRQRWSETMADAAGIDMKKLPTLDEGAACLGGLINEDIIALGVPAGTPVSCGAGDTVCSLLALGADRGKAMLSMGTSHVLYAVSDRDCFNRKLMARSHVFYDRWAEGGAMSGPGAMLRWFRDNYCADLVESGRLLDKSAYELIDREAAQTPPGADGVICLPYINGERSPIYDSAARAVFLGVGLGTTRAHLARAIMEGAAYGIRQFLEILDEDVGAGINDIVVVGGGSRSDFMVQTAADVCGRTLHVSSLADVGAVGAAMTGAMAAGCVPRDYKLPENSIRRVFTPDASLKQLYDKGFERYNKLYPAVKELF